MEIKTFKVSPNCRIAASAYHLLSTVLSTKPGLVSQIRLNNFGTCSQIYEVTREDECHKEDEIANKSGQPIAAIETLTNSGH